MEEVDPLEKINLMICGQSGSGKRSLAWRFATDMPPNMNYSCWPPLDDEATKAIEINGKKTLVCVLIGSSAAEYEAHQIHSYRKREGFALVYSIDSRLSFEEISPLHDKILSLKDTERVPMVLVGHKCDKESDRQVTSEEGKTLAQKLDVPFFEASAITGTCVKEPFECLAKMVKKSMEEKQMQLQQLKNDLAQIPLWKVWKRKEIEKQIKEISYG